jgi:glycerol uptake facilitator-like aquaporin
MFERKNPAGNQEMAAKSIGAAFLVWGSSSCCINPTLTRPMVCAKRMSWDDAFKYWIAQMIGVFVDPAVVAI